MNETKTIKMKTENIKIKLIPNINKTYLRDTKITVVTIG